MRFALWALGCYLTLDLCLRFLSALCEVCLSDLQSCGVTEFFVSSLLIRCSFSALGWHFSSGACNAAKIWGGGTGGPLCIIALSFGMRGVLNLRLLLSSLVWILGLFLDPRLNVLPNSEGTLAHGGTQCGVTVRQWS